MTSGSYVKAASEVLDYSLDYTDVLSSETISSSTWAVAPSTITISSSSNTTTATTVWLSGGTAGQVYTVTNTVVTSGGRTFQRSITVQVGPRAGMINLIREMRMLCAAGTADHTIAGETFWNDGHLQTQLDQTRRDVKMGMLQAEPVYTNGTEQWLDYVIPLEYGKYFEEASTSGAFVVKDESGGTIGTANYTVDYRARRITFTSDQAGVNRYVDARSYDLYGAAAQIWEKKAGFAAVQFDWNSDNHGVKKSQVYEHYMAQAKRMKSMAGIQTVTMTRPDERW